MRPDPPSRYEIERLTHGFLRRPKTDTADRDALMRSFEVMAASVPAVEQQMKQSPILAEVEVRAQQLPGLATAGLEAITGSSSPPTNEMAGSQQSGPISIGEQIAAFNLGAPEIASVRRS